MSRSPNRSLAAWAGTGRRPVGRVAEAVGDLRTLAVGWRWDLTLDVAKAAASTVIGTLKGAEDAPAVPTGWSRSPFATAVRGLAQDAVLGPVLHAEVGLEAYGTDHLGINSGPVLLVANHASHLDSAAVLATLPAQWRERTAVGVTSDQFFQIWWKAGAAALAYNTFQLPAGAAGADSSGQFDPAPPQFDTEPLAQVLRSGWNVLVFPEGGRTRDGVVQPFHDAVAAVAAQLSVPVIPIGIRGTFTALPEGSRWPRRGRPRVAVRYGAPLAAGRAESAEVFTARIHQAVVDLVDEDETTWWAVRRAPNRPGSSGDNGSAATPATQARWRRIWQQSQAPVPGGRAQHHRIWRDATR